MAETAIEKRGNGKRMEAVEEMQSEHPDDDLGVVQSRPGDATTATKSMADARSGREMKGKGTRERMGADSRRRRRGVISNFFETKRE